MTTSVPTTHADGLISVGAERQVAEALTQEAWRRPALLRVDVLQFILDCQRLRDNGTSAACDQVMAKIDGVNNPNRPFLTWDCCDAHRALRGRRAELEKRAAELGETIEFDMTLVLTD